MKRTHFLTRNEQRKLCMLYNKFKEIDEIVDTKNRYVSNIISDLHNCGEHGLAYFLEEIDV